MQRYHKDWESKPRGPRGRRSRPKPVRKKESLEIEPQVTTVAGKVDATSPENGAKQEAKQVNATAATGVEKERKRKLESNPFLKVRQKVSLYDNNGKVIRGASLENPGATPFADSPKQLAALEKNFETYGDNLEEFYKSHGVTIESAILEAEKAHPALVAALSRGRRLASETSIEGQDRLAQTNGAHSVVLKDAEHCLERNKVAVLRLNQWRMKRKAPVSLIDNYKDQEERNALHLEEIETLYLQWKRISRNYLEGIYQYKNITFSNEIEEITGQDYKAGFLTRMEAAAYNSNRRSNKKNLASKRAKYRKVASLALTRSKIAFIEKSIENDVTTE